jgi:hypothetical protein
MSLKLFIINQLHITDIFIVFSQNTEGPFSFEKRPLSILSKLGLKIRVKPKKAKQKTIIRT